MGQIEKIAGEPTQKNEVLKANAETVRISNYPEREISMRKVLNLNGVSPTRGAATYAEIPDSPTPEGCDSSECEDDREKNRTA